MMFFRNGKEILQKTHLLSVSISVSEEIWFVLNKEKNYVSSIATKDIKTICLVFMVFGSHSWVFFNTH
jgi:hypothetical protein